MISVGQNRFQAPQRLAKNNKASNNTNFRGCAETTGREDQIARIQKLNKGYSKITMVAFAALGVAAVTFLTAGNTACKKDRVVAVIDSVSQGKINVKNIDQVIEAQEKAQKAAALQKEVETLSKK